MNQGAVLCTPGTCGEAEDPLPIAGTHRGLQGWKCCAHPAEPIVTRSLAAQMLWVGAG